MRVVPGSGAAEHVLPLLAGKVLAGEDGAVDGVLVGASPTLEAVVSRLHPREDEKVGTVGADLLFCAKVELG